MNRPRILHVYKDYYPPVVGGIERTIRLMALGTRHEFDVRVLVNSGTRRTWTETVEGIPVTRVAEWRRVASAPVSPAFIGELRRHARNADLLHFHHPNPTGDIACLLNRPQAPAVMTYHSDVVRQQAAMAVYGPIQERMMRACRVIMPTSPNYMESSTWLQRHRDKCRVVPLGIEVDRFQETPEIRQAANALREQYPGPLIAFVGRLRYYKGLHFLIRAMGGVDATLLAVGGGSDLEQLRAEAAALGVAKRCRFLGDLPEPEMTAVLHAADLFCLPSHLRSEALGLSQIEAMASGLPVVSCRIPSGVPFVNQDGLTGLTVEPESPEALARALNKLLGDEPLRRRMGEAARLRASTVFSAARMCDNLMQVYRQVLNFPHSS